MSQTREPYRLLFPVALAFSVWGVAPWIGHAFGLVAYPGAHHSERMLAGFLFLFCAGFLMTALPRFTAQAPANRLEIGGMLGMAGLLAIVETGLVPEHGGAVASFTLAAGLALLVAFGARRAIRARMLPPFFVFVAASVVAGLAGAVLVALAQWQGTVSPMGRALLLGGLVPGLVLGVGLRIVPMLLGIPADGPFPSPASWSPRRVAILAAAFVASLGLEGLEFPLVGRLLRAAVVGVVVFGTWAVHRRSPRHGVQSVGLRVSAIAFFSGHLVQALAPAWGVHGAHLVYVGGLGVTTLLVATRVTLSHGGFELEPEVRSRALAICAGAGLLAMVVRVLAPVAGMHYVAVLAVAAGLWMVALAAWIVRFARALRPQRASSAPSASTSRLR